MSATWTSSRTTAPRRLRTAWANSAGTADCSRGQDMPRPEAPAVTTTRLPLSGSVAHGDVPVAREQLRGCPPHRDLRADQQRRAAVGAGELGAVGTVAIQARRGLERPLAGTGRAGPELARHRHSSRSPYRGTTPAVRPDVTSSPCHDPPTERWIPPGVSPPAPPPPAQPLAAPPPAAARVPSPTRTGSAGRQRAVPRGERQPQGERGAGARRAVHVERPAGE